MSDFSWTGDSENVVFPSTQGVAIYTNPNGDIVIRQQAGVLDDEDSLVVIPKGQAESFMFSFQSEAGLH